MTDLLDCSEKFLKFFQWEQAFFNTIGKPSICDPKVPLRKFLFLIRKQYYFFIF